MQPSAEQQTRVVFDAQIANLAAIRCTVMTAAEAAGLPRETAEAMIQAVDEAATNIIFHGYSGRPGSIEVAIRADGHGLVVRLRDDAPAFDPTAVPPPDLDLPLHLRRPGGLGVHLMRQFLDRLSYQRTEAGQNELTLEILAPARSRDPVDRSGAGADRAGRTM